MAFTNPRGETQTELAEINMIPFIDVMLVLLIIFMITAPVIQSGIEVSVPKTQTVNEIAKKELVISIDKDNRLYLESEMVKVDDLARKIREKVPDTKRQSIYFRADKDVSWGLSVVVLDKLKQGGIENISIVTQPVEKRSQ
jgi:biopolymer transport protein ExbD/biopolymer transport protein TolR